MLSALDEDDVRDVFGRDTCQEMESMGIDPYEFYQALFSNFDYSIDDIRVDGDEATVELTVSNVDIERHWLILRMYFRSGLGLKKRSIYTIRVVRMPDGCWNAAVCRYAVQRRSNHLYLRDYD